MPFLCQPRKDQREPRCIPYLRVVESFRVVDHLPDVFLRIRHHRFSRYFLSIKARHTTVFLRTSHWLFLEEQRSRSRLRLSSCPFQANHRIFLPRRGRRSYQPGHGAQPVCRRWSLPGARSAGPWGRLECFWIEVAAVRDLCGISHSPLPPASSRTSATMRRRVADRGIRMNALASRSPSSLATKSST
jgi:hypothetical protein